LSIDVAALWDHGKPELSEQRFRAALVTASGDDELILQTQIARTFGIRKDFDRARQTLKSIESKIESAGYEARVRYALELGRTYCSTTHPPESQTESTRELARQTYMSAFVIAQEGELDGLAVDALHMMVMVDTAPEDQMRWNQKALNLVESSSQPAAKLWEGSLRNNIGYALHLMGRFDEALYQFKFALEARQRTGNPRTIRIAYWMIAWTLRAMNRFDEALEIQLRLESECDAAGEPDTHVLEELEYLYRALNDNIRADSYAARRNEIG